MGKYSYKSADDICMNCTKMDVCTLFDMKHEALNKVFSLYMRYGLTLTSTEYIGVTGCKYHIPKKYSKKETIPLAKSSSIK